MNPFTLTFRGVRVVLHERICAYRGQAHGWGVYFAEAHSPEFVGKDLAAVVRWVNERRS